MAVKKKKKAKKKAQVLWLVGEKLEPVSGYDPNRIQMWNIVGIYDTKEQADDVALHRVDPFVYEFTTNETSKLPLLDGPWYEAPVEVPPE